MEINLSEIKQFLDKDGRLKALPAKNKKKLIVLWYLAEKFSSTKFYTETEVNDLINTWTVFCDPATLRRELFNHGLLHRTLDCSVYKKQASVISLEDFVSKYL